MALAAVASAREASVWGIGLEEALRQSESRLAADLDAMTRLHKVATMFVRGGNLEASLGEIVEAAMAISAADFGNIQLVDEGGKSLRIVAHRGFAKSWLDHWAHAGTGVGSCGTALSRGRRVIVEDIEQEAIFTGTDLEVQLRAGIRAVQSTPVTSREGKLLGMLSTHWRRRWLPEEHVLRLLDLLARQTADIIERARTEKELRESEERLEKLVAERTESLRELVGELEHFSYTITHDMRAPLRAMRAFAEILKESSKERLSGEERTFVARIVTGAERMDSLIMDALNYSKAVRSELPLGPVDVGRLVRGMLDTYPEFQGDQAEITIIGELPVVMGNEAGLTQCFSNLLGNGVKFVRTGVRPRVRIRSETQAGWVRLWVEDEGIGISKDMLPRVFDMFARGSSPKAGTGIGLALVRKVVDRMGGHVGVESEPGKGSRFWVDLRAGDLKHVGAGIIVNGSFGG